MTEPTREQCIAYVTDKLRPVEAYLDAAPTNSPLFEAIQREHETLLAILNLLRSPSTPGVGEPMQSDHVLIQRIQCLKTWAGYLRKSERGKTFDMILERFSREPSPLTAEERRAVECAARLCERAGDGSTTRVIDKVDQSLLTSHAATLRRMANRGRP